MIAKKVVGVLAFALTLLAVTAVASYLGASRGIVEGGELPTEGVPQEIATQSSGTVAKNADTISIPGYEKLCLKADQKEQAISIYNPAHNQCYFIVALLVDNVELFKTEMLKPGAELSQVTMRQKIPAGTYENAKLRYSCYDLDTLQELNGADVMLRLEVEP